MTAATRGRSSSRWQAPVLTLLAVGVAIGFCFPRAGAFLVVNDSFTHADLAVVLSGLPTARTFGASDLYRQGKVDQVLVIPEPPNKIEGEGVSDQIKAQLVALKLVDPALPQWAQRILVATGVPKKKIIMLPRFADGTMTEARLVRNFLERHPPHSLVLVTSKSASRRARFIFRHVFAGTPVAILSSPTPYDPFEATRWWAQPRNALTVVMEYEKLLTNAITLTLGKNWR